jgi:hypothetical protein
MTLINCFEFGEFVNLINEKPVKFRVHADQYLADTGDPLNQIPFNVFFTQYYPKDSEVIKFIVRISSDLRELYFRDNDEEMFFQAIKFGLARIREKSKSKQFDFFIAEYEKMKASLIAPGLSVRNIILNFVNKINTIYPSWNTNALELRVNINTKANQIFQWAEDLVQIEYFIGEKITLTDKIYGGTISRQYRINPKMRMQIETELAQSNIINNGIYPNGSPSISNYGYDFFISHASEDKTPFVESLANALTLEGYKVWYDKFSLMWGDKLRRTIEEGLRSSHYGIVVLSPNFFRKEWPQKELDALFALEESSLRILPIWLNITKEKVAISAPLLADRLAIRADEGIPRIIGAAKMLYTVKSTKSVTSNLSDLEKEILVRAKSNNGAINIIKTGQTEDIIKIGNWATPDPNDRRLCLRYIDAVENLKKLGMVNKSGHSLYELTSKGYQMVDKLLSAGYQLPNN